MPPVHTTSDTLLAGLKAQEAEAFRTFDNVYRPWLVGILRKQAEYLCADDVDEIIQQLRIKVWKGIAAFERRGKGAFRGFLVRVLGNLLRDHGRLLARDRARVAELVAQFKDPDSSISREFDLQELRTAISVLSPQVAAATSEEAVEMFLSCYRDGRKPRDIAASKGIPAADVYKAVWKVKAAFCRLAPDLAEFLD